MSVPRVPVKKILEHLSPEQQKSMHLPMEGELELHSVKEGIWILTPATNSVSSSVTTNHSPAALQPLHQKVLRLMKTHQAADLIEGRFEQFLSMEEQQALSELIAMGKVEKFKTSPKYTLGIYREVRAGVPATAPKPAQNFSTSIAEKPLEEYRLDLDGFEVIRNDAAAKNRSFELAEKLKTSEVKGMKSFDGFYYVIDQQLLEKFLSTAMQFMRTTKKTDLAGVAVHLKTPKILARIVMEFAKEEGSIIEKRKDAFAFVG